MNNVLDPDGVYGTLVNYITIFLLSGGALVAFLVLWKKGRLDFDEEPKHQMMNHDKE